MFGAAAPSAIKALVSPAPRLNVSQNRNAVRIDNMKSSLSMSLKVEAYTLSTTLWDKA
jgi:hypothetical protein